MDWIILVFVLIVAVLCSLLLYYIRRINKTEQENEQLVWDLKEKEKMLANVQKVVSVEAEIKKIVQSVPDAIKSVSSLYADMQSLYLERKLISTYNNSHSMQKTTYIAMSKKIKDTNSFIYRYKKYVYQYEYILNLIRLQVPYVTILKKHEELESAGLQQFEKQYKKELQILKEKDRIEKEYDSKQRNIEKLNEQIKWLYKEREIVDKERVNSEVCELKALLDPFEVRITEAKANIESVGDTPKVLEKISQAWVDYKGLLWEKHLTKTIQDSRVNYETVAELKEKFRRFKQEMAKYKEYEWRYLYLLSLFPDLAEYIDGKATQEEVAEICENGSDERIAYLTREEWEQLSEVKKSQLALNRYNSKRKLTNAQVGRDYEEYIAYLFREKCQGAIINMYGEQKGLADLGRDLIVRHRGKVYIVQCKRWSQDRVIREKHIMQLYGSAMGYCYESRKDNVDPFDMFGKSVIPVFVTTTEISDVATDFAKRLGVVVCRVPMGDYPQIKCNIGARGDKIYHLPFDQQYNNTIIEHSKGEFMAWTVEEADKNGFRRAMKHFSNL